MQKQPQATPQTHPVGVCVLLTSAKCGGQRHEPVLKEQPLHSSADNPGVPPSRGTSVPQL